MGKLCSAMVITITFERPDGQRHDKLGTVTRFGKQFDRTAMRPGHPKCNSQPESRTLTLRREEGFENARLRLPGNARSTVTDPDGQQIAAPIAGEANFAA